MLMIVGLRNLVLVTHQLSVGPGYQRHLVLVPLRAIHLWPVALKLPRVWLSLGASSALLMGQVLSQACAGTHLAL